MRGADDPLRLAALAAPGDFDYRARRLAHPRPAPPLRRIHDLVIVADLPKAAVACTICRTAVRARVRGNIAHCDRARAAAPSFWSPTASTMPARSSRLPRQILHQNMVSKFIRSVSAAEGPCRSR